MKLTRCQLPSKILVVGLPRTGTTSLCRELLDLNYRVAHTAYTQASCEAATVIADTPAYADFNELHRLWQPDMWLYLHRSPATWLPSIRLLMTQLHRQPTDHLPALFWRCWTRVFGPLQADLDDRALIQRYQAHQAAVYQSALAQGVVLRQISLTSDDPEAQTLADALTAPDDPAHILSVKPGYSLNARRVTAWHNLKHPHKISSHLSGPNRRRYYDYEPGR